MAAAATAGVSSRSAAPRAGAAEYLWAYGRGTAQRSPQTGGDLTWRGGHAGAGAIGVESRPAVYLVFWGRAWRRGFRIPDGGGRTYPSRALQRYLVDFFAAVGGSRWAGVLTQYCSGTRPGASTCGAGAGAIANPPHQLAGVWTDPSALSASAYTADPESYSANDPVAREALRAARHFGSDPQATYFVFAPPGGPAPTGPAWCGYHTQTAGPTGSGRVQYAFVPWLNRSWPGGRGTCGMHLVNRASNAFGNGVFDGWSIVAGHEYAEAVTDPDDFRHVQDGWNDGYSTEAADKCAWHDLRDVALGGHRFAVQPLWSNESFACVFSRPAAAVGGVAPNGLG